MGCRLRDFILGPWQTFEVEGHKVEMAPAATKPITYRGKVVPCPTLKGWVYKLDGRFRGFTAMDCDEPRAVESITYHVNRELRGEP